MIKRESKFGILFRHWIMANPQYTCTIEAKQTTSDRIPFSCVKQSQIDWALAVKHSKKGVLVRCQGGGGEPDYIYLKNEPAYVTIRYPDFFCLIDIDAWVLETKNNREKSLESFRARLIASQVIELDKKGGRHARNSRSCSDIQNVH